MDLEEKIKLIPEMSVQALASHIVLYKSLGLFRDFAIKCMEELAKRKANGETFDYDSFIKEELNKIPKLKEGTGAMDAFSMIKSISNDASILGKKQ
jgi:hypothetical protein